MSFVVDLISVDDLAGGVYPPVPVWEVSGDDFQPCNGVACGQAPQHHGSASLIDAPIKGGIPCRIDVREELSAMGIELAECLGLDCKGHGSFCELRSV